MKKINLKNHGWTLTRTRKMKPFDYIGYIFSIYDEDDDTTIILEVKAKTKKQMANKIRELIKNGSLI